MMTEEQQSLRKVAILIACLDQNWAEQILQNFPADVSDQIVRMAEGLGEISDEEQRQVVAEFRRNMANNIVASPINQPEPTSSGVELDPSLMSRMDSLEGNTYGRFSESPAPVRDRSRTNIIETADNETLSQLIVREHPQTIAVVLSRLGNERAAELLTKLPTDLQAEVLSRLAELDTADEQMIEVVETQIAEWITEQQQKQQRMADGANLVQQILDKSPSQQRQTVMTKLKRSRPHLVSGLQVETSREQVPTSIRKTIPQSIPQPKPYIPQPLPNRREVAPVRQLSENPMRELELVSDEALLAAMNQTSQSVLTLALAGASETLLKRILKGFPRKQAKQFRQQLRNITPTKVSEMLSAQQELLERAQAIS